MNNLTQEERDHLLSIILYMTLTSPVVGMVAAGLEGDQRATYLNRLVDWAKGSCPQDSDQRENYIRLRAKVIGAS